MNYRKRSNVTHIEARDRLKATGMSHARFAHSVGYSLDAVREHLSHSTEERIPWWLERALIYEEAWHAIDLLIAAPGKRASKYVLMAIRAKTKIGTKPPKRRTAKRGPRRRNLLAPRFLRPAPPVDELERAETWTALASRVGVDEARRLHAKLSARRPPTLGRPSRDAEDEPKSRTTDPI
jgi:hypothetical protein